MRRIFSKQTALLALACLAVIGPFASYAQQQPPKTVAGKVVAISHEKVNINNVWLDSIHVKVDNCQARGTLTDVHYTPATVSDRTALGHLFDQDLQSARTPNMERQQLPNGFGLFWVDENNKVLRTGILGAGLNCAAVPDMIRQFNP